MAHGTLIGGVQYGITMGKCLVDGTEYDIKNGRTLVDGTGYGISFLGPTTINITGDGSGVYCYVSVNGEKHSERIDQPLFYDAGEQVTMKAVSRGRSHHIIINGVDNTEDTEKEIDCTGKTVDVYLNYQSNNRSSVLRINY